MAVRLINMTIGREVAEFYEKQLRALFGDAVEIFSYSKEREGYEGMADGDLYLITATSTPRELACIPRGKQVVLTGITFRKADVERLKALPDGTPAMLVNNSGEMAIEAIADLNRLGVKNLDLAPYYPGVEEPPDADLAISVGVPELVPPRAREVIRLDHRTFSANTVMEIALRMGRPDLLETEPFIRYCGSLAVTDFTLNDLSTRAFSMENKFEILLGAMDVGIIGVDMDGGVFAFNPAAEQLFGIKKGEMLGRRADDLPPPLPRECFRKGDRAESRLIRVRGADLSLTITPITRQGRYGGYFATVQRFSDEERKQHKFRLQLLSRGHAAKYTFDDIVGECPAMVNAKAIARKMASTGASILLGGESGTGKELFAHAIHQSSPRRDMPFVAINCAALPESLLESELFGYGEGAFTGAKKGGKMGLFEFAHRGTLFLDEVEGMSPNLQVKLLRVLQEKEVMRIGEDRIITIDVRIIAAANEDILQMVRAGRFRKDLYYRLNTLPINLPPLRSRGRDILLIAQSIRRQVGADFTLTPEAEAAMLAYRWDGNVRELRNIVEYLKYMGLPVIGAGDLPEVLREAPLDSTPAPRPLEVFRTLCGEREEAYAFVLDSLKRAGDAGVPLGRRQLAQAAARRGIPLSEQGVRTVCAGLLRCGFLQAGPGGRGKRLTPAGEQVWRELGRRG